MNDNPLNSKLAILKFGLEFGLKFGLEFGLEFVFCLNCRY
jgi:hypothetical protein